MTRFKSIQIEVRNSHGVKTYSLDSKSRFSIGYRQDNSVQIFGSRVPAKFYLLNKKGKSLVLKIKDSMQGEVVTDGSSLAFSDLIKHRLLPKDKDGYILELTEDKKASFKYKENSFTIYYDGLSKAEKGETPYWQFRRRLYRRLKSEPLFKFLVVFFLTLGGISSYQIYKMPFVEAKKINLENYTRHVARIVIKPKEVQPVSIETKSGTGARKEIEEKASEPVPEENRNNVSTNQPTENVTAKSTVANKGLIGLISGKGQATKGSAVIETLVDHGLVRELDEILQSGQNLEIELPSLTDIGEGMDELLSSSKEEVDNEISNLQLDDKVELQEKGDVQLESFSELAGNEKALGWRSEQSIRDVIMSYMGRITYTYNKYLKLDPNLKGKVIVDITVAASGEVKRCEVVSSTMGNDQFVQELVNVVKSFRFKPIPEGEISLQNPFVFYRRDM